MNIVRNGRRLLYICDWLPPDFGAVGQYSVMFARELAAKGDDVTLAGLSTTGNSDHADPFAAVWTFLRIWSQDEVDDDVAHGWQGWSFNSREE